MEVAKARRQGFADVPKVGPSRGSRPDLWTGSWKFRIVIRLSQAEQARPQNSGGGKEDA